MIHALAIPSREAAWEADDAWLRAWRPWIYGLALAIVARPDGAEDVAQESLLRLWLARDRVAEADDPRAYARRVVVNRALSYLSARYPAPLSPQQAALESHVGDVAATLARLDSESRAILALAGFEGLTYAEIAATLGIPEGTVASRLHRARAAFRALWEEA